MVKEKAIRRKLPKEPCPECSLLVSKGHVTRHQNKRRCIALSFAKYFYAKGMRPLTRFKYSIRQSDISCIRVNETCYFKGFDGEMVRALHWAPSWAVDFLELMQAIQVCPTTHNLVATLTYMNKDSEFRALASAKLLLASVVLPPPPPNIDTVAK